MIFGAAIGAMALVLCGVLALIERAGGLSRSIAVLLAVPAGGISGAGVLLGLLHQPTTANIHSGYSFRGLLEWLVLAGAGGVLGAVAAGFVGWRLPSRRAGLVVLIVLAAVGLVGWAASGARPTIDCDDRPSFCEDRYGD